MELKICFKCHQEKLHSEFYKHNKMLDGYLGKCKVCAKKNALEHREKNLEKIREYDRKRGGLKHRIKLNTRTTKRFRQQFPLKYKAYSEINNAIRSGKLTKPDKCPNCNSSRQIEGHHDDYSKPLDVKWLCAACHRQLHRDLRSYHETTT